MGVIRQQSLLSTLYSYLGALIGFANKVVIFGVYLSTEEIGLANILMNVSLMLAPLGQLGMSNTLLRYFPYFRSKQYKHHGLFFWVMVAPLAGILAVFIFYSLARPWLLEIWLKKSPLLAEYEFYIFPLFVFSLYFSVLDSYTRSLYKTVVPIFLKNIAQRLLVTVAVLLYAFGWVNFAEFVFWYIALLSASTLIILAYVVYLKEFNIKPNLGWRMRQLAWKMIGFSLFSVLGSSSTNLSLYIDSLMITMFPSSTGSSDSLSDTGVYTTMVFVTTLILIPWRALLKVAAPRVADHWKDKNIVALDALYKRTSLIALILGIYLFLGMWINRGFIIYLTKPEFQAGMMVMLILGLNRVVEMVTGLNGVILSTSKYYKLDLVFTLGLVVAVILTNLYFIPHMGLTGAALATFLSFAGLNIARSVYVWAVYKTHPLSIKMLWVMGISGLCYGVNYLIPEMNPYLDIVVRSTVLTGIFWGLIWALGISEDLNDMIASTFKKAAKVLGLRKAG
ncbi:MAG: oligosaccharide flippase family protein [Bacteroidia bacterium]|nr:oligosaccharide flippase family protein [Bacteroidia bacterium]